MSYRNSQASEISPNFLINENKFAGFYFSKDIENKMTSFEKCHTNVVSTQDSPEFLQNILMIEFENHFY